MRNPLDDLLDMPEVPNALAKLRALGVAPSLLGRVLTVSASRIQEHGDLFEFDQRGSGAVIIVEGTYTTGPDWDDVYDLIAFRSADPTRWWRYRGAARWLGQDAVDHGAERWPDEDPPRILRTPLDWVRAGGVGCAVPLVPDAAYDLARLPSFLVREPGFGMEIGQRLKTRALEMLPRISVEVVESGERAAA